jgi:hypothetical protein
LLKDYNQAAEILSHSVEQRAFDPVLIDHYGDALWQVGQQEEAAIQWKRALSFEPDKKLKANLEKKIKSGWFDSVTTAANDAAEKPKAEAKPKDKPKKAKSKGETKTQ